MPEEQVIFVLWWRRTPAYRLSDSAKRWHARWIKRATGTREEISTIENRIVDDEPGNHDFLTLPEGEQP
jgi:hypothetical protein